MITSVYDGKTKDVKHQSVADFYDFHHQPYIEYDTVQLTGGDSVIVDCYYDERNAHEAALGVFGLGTFEEMCESCVV